MSHPDDLRPSEKLLWLLGTYILVFVAVTVVVPAAYTPRGASAGLILEKISEFSR